MWWIFCKLLKPQPGKSQEEKVHAITELKSACHPKSSIILQPPACTDRPHKGMMTKHGTHMVTVFQPLIRLKNIHVHFIFLIRKIKIAAERKKQIWSQYSEFMFFRPNLGFMTMVMHGGASQHKTVFFREQLGKILVNKRSF